MLVWVESTAVCDHASRLPCGCEGIPGYYLSLRWVFFFASSHFFMALFGRCGSRSECALRMTGSPSTAGRTGGKSASARREARAAARGRSSRGNTTTTGPTNGKHASSLSLRNGASTCWEEWARKLHLGTSRPEFCCIAFFWWGSFVRYGSHNDLLWHI